MKSRTLALVLTLLLVSCITENEKQTNVSQAGPIALHPDNPHYFLYHGKALALVTSGEHYGALINTAFDFEKYLRTLAGDGLNYTRVFAGTYFEVPGESFGIRHNTLAPHPDDLLTPWQVVRRPGQDRPLYDLSKWNTTYFERLRRLMHLAAELDIIVEITLFSSSYRDLHWNVSPQNPANNINISHPIQRLDAHTLDNGELLSYQEALVRKLVRSLNDFDNFFIEIQNEPWADRTIPVYNIVNKEDLRDGDWTTKADFADDASLAWQRKIASLIQDEERALPNQHLIAQNFSNYKVPIPALDSSISIINFHYAWPEAVQWNDHYNRVIGFDESGFAGSGNTVYRRQAWRFMLSGGGLFNNLDYSFYPGHEDGTGLNEAPGGGGALLRKQLGVLSRFLHGFKLERLWPVTTCIHRSPGLIPYVLSDQSSIYAVYLQAVGTEVSTLELKVPGHHYKVLQISTMNGDIISEKMVEAERGILSMALQLPEKELALKIVKM